MTTMPINIVMDDRERSPVIYKCLEAMNDVKVSIRRLPVGDFQVGRWLAIERKTLHDFSISVIDGRFFRQMEQLAISPLKGVLILEGGSRDLDHVGVRREAMQGALIFATLILGIPILRSLEATETASLIVYSARQIKLAGTGVVKRAGRRPKGKRKRQLYLLQGLPGIGPVRAKHLLNHFGSVRNVFAANPEELAAVAGIGGHIARRIHWAVGESMPSYGIRSEPMPEL